MAEAEEPIRFTPRRRVRRRGIALAWVIGPVLWTIMLVAAAVVIRRTNAIGIALAVTLISLALGLAVQLPFALRRHRRAVR